MWWAGSWSHSGQGIWTVWTDLNPVMRDENCSHEGDPRVSSLGEARATMQASKCLGLHRLILCFPPSHSLWVPWGVCEVVRGPQGP